MRDGDHTQEVLEAGAHGRGSPFHSERSPKQARVEPHSAEAKGPWRRYHSGWSAWNHVRAAAALAALAAAAVLTIALHV